jgi:hypothetical protein
VNPIKCAGVHVDESVPMDDDESSEWLHRENWDPNMEGLLVGTHNQGYPSNNSMLSS